MSQERGPGLPVWLRQASQIAWRFLVVAAALGLLGWVLVRLRIVVIPLLLGLFVASVWSPVVFWLRKRGFPALVAVWVVLIVGMGALTGVIWAVVDAISGQFTELTNAVGEGWDAIQDWMRSGPLDLSQERIDELIAEVEDRLQQNADSLLGGVIGGVGLLGEVIAAFFLTAVSAFFILKDGAAAWRWFVSRFAAHRRADVDQAGVIAWVTMRKYLAGTAAVGVVDAVLIGTGLLILGVPLVLPLAILVFLGAFFPFIGAFLSGMVAALVALAAEGVTDAIIVVLIVTAVQQVEGDVLAPVLLGRAVSLHPLIVLLALAVGVVIAGVLGAFLAVPLTGIGFQVIRHLQPDWLRTRGDPLAA